VTIIILLDVVSDELAPDFNQNSGMKQHQKRWAAHRIIVLLAMFVLYSGTRSQQLPSDATGTWLELVSDNALSKRWSIPVVGVLRQYDLGHETEFAFLRTGATYAFPNTHLKATLGLAYLDNLPFEQELFRPEEYQFWLYEELTIVNSPKWSQRFRLEHRWIHGAEENHTDHRLRYRLQFQSTLAQNFYFKCSDEPFFSFKEANIDQNRFFIGFGKKLATNISVEIGYMKNHIGKNSYDRVRMALFFKTSLCRESLDLISKNDKLSISQ
tara:strand:- start:816 stop:1622 length:807 start_codon:yes stop_codon:yes gene_type:complete